MHPLKVAAVQMKCTPLDPESNLVAVIDWIVRAAALGVTLVVFPECALTGYALSRDEVKKCAEPIPGNRTERLHQVCQATGVTVVVGTLESDEQDRDFNSAVLIGPTGLLATYRKTHLPGFGLDRVVSPGAELGGPFDTPAGRCGLLICYDIYFPEPFRVLALAGAQLILVPAAWSSSASYYPDFIARTRSAENSLYLIASDHVGVERDTKFLGRSIVTGPDGEILAEGDSEEEGLLVCDLDLAKSDHKERIFQPGVDEIDLFADRRPELYGSIASHPLES